MSKFDPMADVIEQMPEASEFADQIHIPGENGEDPTLDPSRSQTDEGTGTGTGTIPGETDFGFEVPGTKPVEAETFDPSIHCVGADGQPVMTKSGKFRRKRGKANAQPSPSLTDVDPTRMANAKAAAQVSIAATFLAGQIVFGAEPGSPQPGEIEQMDTAYTQFYYLSEKPIKVEPWMLVLMVTATYAAKRMAMEEPRNRVMNGVDWIVIKVKNLWAWATDW